MADTLPYGSFELERGYGTSQSDGGIANVLASILGTINQIAATSVPLANTAANVRLAIQNVQTAVGRGGKKTGAGKVATRNQYRAQIRELQGQLGLMQLEKLYGSTVPDVAKSDNGPLMLGLAAVAVFALARE